MNILLHICCGICAAPVAERLMRDGHRVTGFFYNPNIHPEDEYGRRLEVARRVAKEVGFELIEGPYDRERWFEAVKGKEYSPEGGARCIVCYEMRLRKTYEQMRKKNLDAFTTTLTVSPHKAAETINKVGMDIGGEKFLLFDFKKRGGFQRATELAKEWGLYRQHYCGCIHSLEASISREKQKKDEKEGE